MRKQLFNALPDDLKDYSLHIGKAGYYLTWNETKGASKGWERLFEVPEPIVYEHAKKLSGNLFQHGFSNFWGQIGDGNVPDISENGYIRLAFPFLRQRAVSVHESKADYRNMLKQFDLDMTKPELIIKVGTYRDILFKQMERQAREVCRLNTNIAQVIKVLFYETQQAINPLPIREFFHGSNHGSPLAIHDIIQFFRKAILGGASVELLQTYWIPEKIESNGFVSDQLRQATSYGLLILAEEREPVLQIAENLARLLLPLETLLENIINGNKFSDIDHARKQMPDPWVVASNFQQRARNVVYDNEIVATAMAETREYILRNDLRTLKRHVEAIKRIILDIIPVNPDPKTIRNWITTYGEQVFSLQKDSEEKLLNE